MSSKSAIQDALALNAQGRRDEALGLLEALNRGHPADLEVRYCLGAVAAEAGRNELARQHIGAVLAARGDHFGAASILSNVHRAGGDAAACVALWRQFLAAAPADPRGRILLIEALLIAGDPSAADALAGSLPPGPGEAELRLAVAQTYHAAGFELRAIEHYRRCLALRPGFAPARQSLAAALQSVGDLDAAEPLYRGLLAENPANVEVLGNLGTLYKDRGDLGEALSWYGRAMALRRKRLEPGEIATAGADPAARTTTLHSLRLEREQLEYLGEQGIGPADGAELIAGYDAVIAGLESAGVGGQRIVLPEQHYARIGAVMQRLVHLEETPALAGGALNPELDYPAIEARFEQAAPGIVVVDDFLRPEALAALRRYCHRSTIWFGYGKVRGYCGAYMQDGFGNALLLQLARELQDKLPTVVGPHYLNQMWGYIYDQRMAGITAHADPAAVNLNFWIVPDEASLAPDIGGLVVSKREAPAEWDFAEYNNRPEVLDRYMDDSEQVRVPYRCNRMVMFNSNLVHKTDEFEFRPGFTNRRINITMLFGQRRGPQTPAT